MNKLLAISIASASIAIGAIPAVAEVDSKIHALCLDAKDYSGCVQTQTSLSSKTEVAPIDSTKSEPIESTAWQKHLNENPNLKAWVQANPALEDSWKTKWLDEQKGKGQGCSADEYFHEPSKECISVGKDKRLWTACPNVSAIHIWNGEKCAPMPYVADQEESTTYYDQHSVCPPGKSLRQKTTFLGLIKLGKVCLSDYEVEALRQGERHRALQNFSNSMKSLSESMQPPKVINCYSNTYGNYTSTSCY